MAMYDNEVQLQNINKPGSKHIRVAVNRVQRCPKEVKDLAEETENTNVAEERFTGELRNLESGTNEHPPVELQDDDDISPWKGQLRSRQISHSEDA